MDRRKFLLNTSGVALASLAGNAACTEKQEPESNKDTPKGTGKPYPLAITMWEFSWLERRWPGAGYEDWDKALSELVERGYDAVRIDPFHHHVVPEIARFPPGPEPQPTPRHPL